MQAIMLHQTLRALINNMPEILTGHIAWECCEIAVIMVLSIYICVKNRMWLWKQKLCCWAVKAFFIVKTGY